MSLRSRRGISFCGWFQSPGLSVLKLNGPWYEEVSADARADPGRGFSEYWVRKAGK